MKRSIQRGFTVIELAVVIVVISILVTIVVVMYSRAQVDARDTKRANDMNIFTASLEKYYEANGEYPSGCSNYTLASASACDVTSKLSTYGTNRIFTDTTTTALQGFLSNIPSQFGDTRGVSGSPFSKASGTTSRYVYRGGYNGVGTTSTTSPLFGTGGAEILCGTGDAFGYTIPAGGSKVTSYMAAYYSEGDAKWYIYQGKYGEELKNISSTAEVRGSTVGNCVFMP